MSNEKTYIDEKGYLRFISSNRPVHQWMAEKKLGRKLKSKEVVHHIDRNKLNNSMDNLHVFPNQAAHDAAHKYDAYRFGKKASYQGFRSLRKRYQKEKGTSNLIILLMAIVIAYLLYKFRIIH
ncbi:MAG: hypothetical protein JWN78_757 [Bacteroidota bacterium]|nr:hypothetical protein [Bacteroidota bacterium]